MVDRSDRGVGDGRALVNAGERSMRAAGFSIATLWVVPTNARALRCYERGGWTPDGAERVVEVGGRSIRTVRCQRS